VPIHPRLQGGAFSAPAGKKWRLKGMKIGITGGCGFVGSNLAERFACAGHNVVVLDNLTRRGSSFNRERLRKYNISFLHADIRNSGDLKILSTCDSILNCAAHASVIQAEKEPFFNFSNNTIGLLNILEIIRETKVPLIHWGSNKIYPSETTNALPILEQESRFAWDIDVLRNHHYTGLTVSNSSSGEIIVKGINESLPVGIGERSVYGATKACSDILCQEYRDAFKVPIFANRFSCLAGPWQYGIVDQGWYVWFIIAAYFSVPITYYGWKGKQVRDVLFIEDVCSLVEQQLSSALEGVSSGGVYNIGGGINNALSLREHIDMLRSAGLKTTVQAELAPQRRGDQVIYISDIGKAQRDFNWSPKVTLEAGFNECLSWVANNSSTLASLYQY
jgi:CDP-paratose 2-epimerase